MQTHPASCSSGSPPSQATLETLQGHEMTLGRAGSGGLQKWARGPPTNSRWPPTAPEPCIQQSVLSATVPTRDAVQTLTMTSTRYAKTRQLPGKGHSSPTRKLRPQGTLSGHANASQGANAKTAFSVETRPSPAPFHITPELSADDMPVSSGSGQSLEKACSGWPSTLNSPHCQAARSPQCSHRCGSRGPHPPCLPGP